MINVGKINSLEVVKIAEFGLFLDVMAAGKVAVFYVEIQEGWKEFREPVEGTG